MQRNWGARQGGEEACAGKPGRLSLIHRIVRNYMENPRVFSNSVSLQNLGEVLYWIMNKL